VSYPGNFNHDYFDERNSQILNGTNTVVREVLDERMRELHELGWSRSHDDEMFQLEGGDHFVDLILHRCHQISGVTSTRPDDTPKGLFAQIAALAIAAMETIDRAEHVP
jgi:hypothetical protein